MATSEKNSIDAHRRIALIIGNQSYKIKPLNNAKNDANDLADVLRKIGFDVTLIINGGRAEMIKSIEKFACRIRDQDLVLFYFAGHTNV